MSRLQSIRLAQFWQFRIKPLLISDEQECSYFWKEELFESVGWLIEGVFCGFFDAHEVDVTWVRLRPLAVRALEMSSLAFTWQMERMIRLMNSAEPFRQSMQMGDGRQKAFELPLFSHALLLSNFIFGDALAGSCTFLLVGADDQWGETTREWHPVEPARVLECLTGRSDSIDSASVRLMSSIKSLLSALRSEPLPEPEHKHKLRSRKRTSRFELQRDRSCSLDSNTIVAGYIRLLEHMESSRSFFRYAQRMAQRGDDFESYRRRIGGLNHWRVPLSNRVGVGRFKMLSEVLEYTIRQIIPEADRSGWSEFQDSFHRYLGALVTDWEDRHISMPEEAVMV